MSIVSILSVQYVPKSVVTKRQFSKLAIDVAAFAYEHHFLFFKNLQLVFLKEICNEYAVQKQPLSKILSILLVVKVGICS